MVAKKRKPAGPTLASKIKGTIEKFVKGKRSFTANDIYEDLVQRDRSVKKQSVITSVLKQMNSSFANVKVTEKAGKGPRAVKFYRPA